MASTGEAIDLSGDGGVTKTIITPGLGEATPPSGSEVFVHYVGTLLDGTVFDSSRDRGQEFTFNLGKGAVIKGWDLGVASMKRGEKAMLVCKSDYAYGSAGSPPSIPPGATLNFEVELIRWKDDSDLFGDGCVSKVVKHTSDDWRAVDAGNYAKILYTVRAEDGTVLDDSHATDPFEVPFVNSATHPGTESALSHFLLGMKQKETAEFTLKAPHKIGHGIDYPKGDETVKIEVTLVLHGKVEDVSKDGRVTKKTVQAGDGWEQPTDGAKVQYHIRVLSLAREVLYDSRVGGGEPLQAIAGQGDDIEAMDFILTNLKQDEIAEFTVDPSMAYNGTYPPPPGVPVNTGVIVEVQLLSITKGKESWNMSLDDKLEAANVKKDHGNLFFKQANYGRAIRYYDAVVKLFPEAKGQASEKDKATAVAGKPLKVACLLNTAACHLKRQDWPHALKSCNKALDIEPRNVKGLFRAAQANIELDNYYEAKRALNEILLIEPENAEAVRELKRLRSKETQQDAKDKKTFAAMFGK